MQIYGLKSCDTCRKALAAHPQAVLVDLRRDGLPQAVLAQAIAGFGAALVNRRSTTWRGLDAAAQALPTEDLIRAHPSVMKRPLIVAADGSLRLGWGKAQLEAAPQG